MRLIDADQMATDESEAYMNASLLVKDNVDSGINYIVHKKIQKLIADTPTVDPIKHAHWIFCKDMESKYIRCSNCGAESGYDNEINWLWGDYCKYCGAKMDEAIK